jgi:imidazole glycerol-phosphate synthase subunit HisF
LDIMNGRTVKGIAFEQLRDAGNPVELAQAYAAQGADELVFLDITATIENRKTLVQLVSDIAAGINIPFTVGGGINTVADAKELVNAGADKISINSAAFNNPALITGIATALGSQCVVVAIDTKYANGEWNVFVHGGRTATNSTAVDWAATAEQMGAGEILLTSMNNDGAKNGFDITITQRIANRVNIPVIASGGAGTKEHFKQVFERTKAAAALAASVFHFGEISIPELKEYLKTAQIPVR